MKWSALLPGRDAASFLILVLLLICAAPWNPVQDWFVLDRHALADGQYWRLITGHLVHAGWPHLFLNIAGLLILLQLFGVVLPVRNWVGIALFTALSASLLFMQFSAYQRYYGFSSVLHGLYVASAILALRREPLLACLVLFAITAKIVLEQSQGTTVAMTELIGMPVATDMHLYGAVAGALAGIWLLVKRGRR